MMKRRHAYVPVAPVALEDRAVPSHVPMARPAAAMPVRAAGTSRDLQVLTLLEGTIRGVEIPVARRPGVFRLVGQEDLATPGASRSKPRVAGVLQEGADGQLGRASLTLSTARGSLKLQFQRFDAPTPAQTAGTTFLCVSVVGGTGIYRGIAGSRFAQIVEGAAVGTSARRTFTLGFGNDPPAATADPPPAFPSEVLPLYGAIQGDAGSTADLRGEGTVAPLGEVQVVASLTYGPDTIDGAMTLSNAAGTVTLHIGRDPAEPMGPLLYQIVGGTGNYAGVAGSGPILYYSGTISVQPGPGPTVHFPFVFTFGDAPGPMIAM
jgi:hypothetical protein